MIKPLKMITYVTKAQLIAWGEVDPDPEKQTPEMRAMHPHEYMPRELGQLIGYKIP